MTNKHTEKIKKMELILPPAPKPAGVYRPTLVIDRFLYVSGQGPVNKDGTYIIGKVGSDLNKEEASVLSMLNHKGEVTSDLLAIHLKLPISKIMHLLFQLELKGLVKAIAGNRYSKS